MRRALAGIVALSAGASPIGVLLMLRRMSLTGDAMAHAILPGAAAGFLVAGLDLLPMAAGGLVAGLVVALLSGLVSRATPLKEDASLASFYLISLALGVTLVSIGGSNVDLMHVLFGSVLAMDDQALVLIAGVATVSLVALAVIYRPLVIECVDPGFLATVSRLGPVVHLTFLGLVVLNLVAGYQALGTLLSVGLMMLPAAAARFWARSLGRLMLVAFAAAVISGFCGLLVSYHLGLPSGPAIVLVAGVGYGVSLALGPVDGVLTGLVRRRHRAA
ncbi:MAG: metal ABC transporter permease [Hyphomicrobiaceae bacterium]